MRVDSGVEGGSEVTPMYDPMVAKLIVWDVDREKATRRMLRALGEYDSGGLTTLIPFHEAILATEQWAKGETCRDLMEDRDWLKSTAPADAAPPEPSEDGAEMVTRDYKVEVSGKLFDVKVIGEAGAGGAAPAAGGKKPPKRERKAGGGAAASSEALPSPLQGTVFKVVVEQGAEVAEGDLICVIEAMKMENEITAHRAGKVTSLNVEVGDAVTSGDTLAPSSSAAALRRRPDLLRLLPAVPFLLPSFSRSRSRCSFSFCAFDLQLLLAGQRDFGATSWQVRPTQVSSRSSSAWRKARIGKKLGSRALLLSS